MYEFLKYFFVNFLMVIFLSLKCENEDYVFLMIMCDFFVVLVFYKYWIFGKYLKYDFLVSKMSLCYCVNNFLNNEYLYVF